MELVTAMHDYVVSHPGVALATFTNVGVILISWLLARNYRLALRDVLAKLN